ncbi:unnamed protein product [Arctia plantaginis]|uniref:Uncharacterized protein n=1 Tax=Arctia plantaginis TaxID=874455 RepID=A0A8S0YNG0_ARCPL|nr:unnamed protein product [Arctia plantaginis]
MIQMIPKAIKDLTLLPLYIKFSGLNKPTDEPALIQIKVNINKADRDDRNGGGGNGGGNGSGKDGDKGPWLVIGK